MNLKVVPNVRKNNRGLSFHVNFTGVHISKALYKALGEPNNIVFAVDDVENIIGIAPSDEANPNSYKVTLNKKSFSAMVSCIRITKILRGMTDNPHTPRTFKCDEKFGEYYIARVKESNND